MLLRSQIVVSIDGLLKPEDLVDDRLEFATADEAIHVAEGGSRPYKNASYGERHGHRSPGDVNVLCAGFFDEAYRMDVTPKGYRLDGPAQSSRASNLDDMVNAFPTGLIVLGEAANT